MHAVCLLDEGGRTEMCPPSQFCLVGGWQILLMVRKVGPSPVICVGFWDSCKGTQCLIPANDTLNISQSSNW